MLRILAGRIHGVLLMKQEQIRNWGLMVSLPESAWRHLCIPGHCDRSCKEREKENTQSLHEYLNALATVVGEGAGFLVILIFLSVFW